jgi:tetratricopeptide (TPR) repeat protein
LLQRWFKENKPLGRVLADLESLEPQAATLYKEGKYSFENGDQDGAEMLARRALAINPNHVQARLLLGRIHLLRGHPAEAVSAIGSAYASDPLAARADLVTALLALAEVQTDVDEQWRTLSRAARIEPNLPLIKKQQAAVLRSWAQRAEKEGDYETALNVYERLNDDAGATAMRRKLRQQSIMARLPGFLKFSTK